MEIPTGNTRDDIKAREKIIFEFYNDWEKRNPKKCRYNLNLKENINIRAISLIETSEKAARNYLSTLAVLQLDAVLTNAVKKSVAKAKENENQKGFVKMMRMECDLPGIGKVLLRVGVKKGKGKEKVQYCITVISA